MDGGVGTTAPQRRNNTRVSQACHRCKDKKIRCDGKTPTCSSCARLHLPCDFAPVQRKRGQGKSKEYMKNLEDRLANMENAFQRSGMSLSVPPPAADGPWRVGEQSSESSIQASQSAQMTAAMHTGDMIRTENRSGSPFGHAYPVSTGASPPRPPPIAVPVHDFLQGITNRLKYMKQETRYESFQQQVFAPLFTPEALKTFVGEVFDEVTAPFPFLEWKTFEARIDDPSLSGDKVWRACLNANLAMTAFFRAASSAFHELQGVVWAYFKTAFAIFPELIVYGSNLDAIEAILSMAMFMRGSPDAQTLSLLVSSADRLYQIVCMQPRAASTTSDNPKTQRRTRVYWALNLLEQELSTKHGLLPVLENSSEVPDLPVCNAASTPVMRAYCKRVELASTESTIQRSLYSPRLVPQDMQYTMELIHKLDSGLIGWKLGQGTHIEIDPVTSSLDEQDLHMIIHIVGLHLAYYNCMMLIHWSARRFQEDAALNPRHIVPENSEWTPALSAVRSMEAARDALSLTRHLSSLPFSTIWTFLSHLISAHITLLALILDRPTNPYAVSYVSAMESFVKSLRNITVEEGYDLHQMTAGCAQMATIARNSVEAATAPSSSRHYSTYERNQAIRKLINDAAHPMYLAQNFMSNLRNKDYDVAVALARELGIEWIAEQRYGPFVPKSLMPETYAFRFEAARDQPRGHD